LRRIGQVQRGFAQRAGHAVERRGPGQELPLTGGDPRQQLRFDILAHELVIAAERGRRAWQRAALLQGQRRQVQPGRPSLGALVQAGQVVLADLHLRVAQQDGRFLAGRGGQRVEHPLADRLHQVQRFGDIGEQDLGVIVSVIY